MFKSKVFRANRLSTRFALVALALVAMVFTSVAASAAPASVTVQLGTQNNSGQSGTATLTDMGNGQTKVVINITPGAVGVAQPAHIHDGTCTNLNPVPKYPLSAVKNGSSETTVNISLSDLLAKPYAINLHKSVADIKTYVACGDILATSNIPAAAPATGAGGAAVAAESGGYGLLALIAALVVIASVSLVVVLRRKGAARH